MLNKAGLQFEDATWQTGRNTGFFAFLFNFPFFRQGAGKFQIAQNYVPGICTHIFYAFAYLNSSFQLYPTDQSDLGANGGYAQLGQIKQRDPNLKVNFA